MSSINKDKLVKRNDAVLKSTRRIHPINENWFLNNQVSGNGHSQTGMNNKRNELFLKGKLQNGVGESKTKFGDAKSPHISTRGIRERIVNMLALKSYTRLELHSILQQEGIKECESSVIPIVLRDVAQAYKGAYSLRLGIWREVNQCWPFYTEQQQLQVKLRKERYLRTPVSDDDISVTSSSSSNNRVSPPQMHDNELRSSGSDIHLQSSKKRRMDHTSEPNNYESETQTSKKMPPNYEFPEFTEVLNMEQRNKYKSAFDIIHEEYMPLWHHTNNLECSFRALGGQIIDTPADHPDYDRIKQCIVNKFKLINSEDELKRKSLCEYLHYKLAHIKELVMHFDRKRRKQVTLTNQYRQEQQHMEAATDGIIAIPKCDGVPSMKDNVAAKAPIKTPPAKYDILADDLALSDSDED